MKENIKTFINEAFNYRERLEECSINRSADRYLLEYIAYGLSKYKSVNNFIKNVDKWIRSLTSIYSELGFDHKSNQITAVINYTDQLIVVDQSLYDELSYIINILDKYGLIIEFNKPGEPKKSMTLLHFFETVERMYPKIKDRYKGLGSSAPSVSREVIMDPRTRRLLRVKISDLDKTVDTLATLVGDGKYNKEQRKDMLMNFKFTMDMIDN